MTAPELTDRARRNIENGATTGAGTDICSACGGRKEVTRLNSSQCKPCNTPGAVRVGLKLNIPTEIMAAIKKEAARHDQSPAERVTYLLIKKYSL